MEPSRLRQALHSLPGSKAKRQRRGRPMSHQGSCSSEPAGDLAEVLMLDGAFDRSNAAQVELALGDAIDADKPQLVIDLRGVSFLDSTMLRVLIQGLGDTAARGGQLALIRPNATVWRVFVLTGLSHSFRRRGRPPGQRRP